MPHGRGVAPEPHSTEETTPTDSRHDSPSHEPSSENAGSSLFALAFDRAPIGMVVTDLHGVIERANDAMTALTGLSANELTGRSLWGLLGILAPTARHRLDGFEIQLGFRTAQAEDRWVRLRTSIIEAGDDVRIVAQLADLTSMRTAQRRLEELLAAKDRSHRFEDALAECSRALLMTQDESDIDAALAAVLTAVDAYSIHVETNVEDPELGLCTSLVNRVAKPRDDLAGEVRTRVPWSQMPTAYATLSQGLPYMLDLDRLGPEERAAHEGTLRSSGLDVPIFVDGRWRGLIGFSDRRHTREWSDDDVQLLRRTAEMVGALWARRDGQAELRAAVAATTKRLRYEQALSDCAQVLLSTPGEHALVTAVEALLTATAATHGFIEMNVDHPELGPCSRMLIDASVGEDSAKPDHDEYWALVPWARMPDSHARLSAGEPHIFTVDELGPVEAELYAGDPYPIQSEIDVPIFVAGDWVGLIGFADAEKSRRWDPEDLLLLETAATMIGAFWTSERAQQHLTEIIRSKDDLIAAVSHELRTPLTAVVGLAAELRDREPDFVTDERREFVSLIAGQSLEVANLVEDLLVAAREDLSTLSVKPEAICLRSETEAAAATMQAAPHVDLPNDIIEAWADPIRVRQIVRNLLSNAERYGGPNVTIEFVDDGDRVALRVIDDGAGVDPEHRDAIFEPYVRNVGRTAQAAVGLGLTISRNLARLMGGDLTYGREDGLTVFELTLPVPEERGGPVYFLAAS